MKTNVKMIAAIGMLTAIAYVVMVVGRIPVVLFLKYEPSDVVVTLGGFIFGPAAALVITILKAFLEMVTVSDTGIIGCVMNIVQTLSFAFVASLIYKKKHSIQGALIGLFTAFAVSVGVMILWNYLITPLYMGVPREEVAKMLLPVFLPFNLIKGGLNLGFTFLLYKPVVTALRKGNIIPPVQESGRKIHVGIIIMAFLVIITCVMVALMLNHVI